MAWHWLEWCSRSGKLEHAFILIEEDLAYLGEDFDVQKVVENSENLAKKNNVKLRALKEHKEGDSLCQFLQDFFTSCAGADNDLEIIIDNLVKFPNWPTELKLVELFQTFPFFFH